MADSSNTVVPEAPEGGAGTCQVVSMVSETSEFSGAADRVPDVVHQLVPDSVPMVTLHEAASVLPRFGAGSVAANLSPMASPASTVTEDWGESHCTLGGAFSVAHPVTINAISAQVKAGFHRCAMGERYFVNRGVNAWLKEGSAAPLCGG